MDSTCAPLRRRVPDADSGDSIIARVLEANEGPRTSYLLIGHVTRDRIRVEADAAGGVLESIGGTASYSGLTAAAYGAATRLFTSCKADEAFPDLEGIEIRRLPSAHTTTFENVYDGGSRRQRILEVAETLTGDHLPEDWRSADIIHLGPVAAEVEPGCFAAAGNGLRCATLQGWMREWRDGEPVRRAVRPEVFTVAEAADTVVLSMEDLNGEMSLAERLADVCPVTVITDGADGCRVYWNGHLRGFPAPKVNAVDPTGAGDVFAAVFFLRLHETRDPYEAARMANAIAAHSVTRPGLGGVPTHREILEAKMVIERP